MAGLKTPTLLDPTPADVARIIKAARLPERIVPLCLRGDLQADYETLQDEYVKAAAADTGRMGGNPEAAELQTRMDALAAEMAASVLRFRIRALGRPEMRALTVENPARDGVAADAVGYNTEVVEREMVRRGLVWPVLDDALWDALEPALTSGQTRQLVEAAYALGYQEVSVPFSLTDSARSPASAES